ncbi:MAG: hypothetical protein R3F11_12630 [Verrucomicrobiales bacterium]
MFLPVFLDRINGIYGIGFWIAAKRKSWRKKEGGFLGRKISAGFLDRINGAFGIGFWIAAKGKVGEKGVGELLLVTGRILPKRLVGWDY